MNNFKILFVTVLTVFMSAGLFAQNDPSSDQFGLTPTNETYFPASKRVIFGGQNNSTANSQARTIVKQNMLVGSSKGTGPDNFWPDSRGLYVGDAGSIIDKDNGYLNVVGRDRLAFHVNSIGTDGPMLEAMIINRNGQVGIGVDPGAFDQRCAFEFELSIGGEMIAEEVKVALQETSEWPDYVFTPEYNLTPLAELESQIKELGHLPNIPSAEEVEANGFFLGEMDAMLLEKIEELTIHLIDLNKEVQAVKAENAQLKANK